MKLKGKKIFIVEDNSLNRVVYRIIFGQQQARVTFDTWGRNAIRELEKYDDWDLIILDLMLSRTTSGYSVFEDIRKLSVYDKTPIIAISASDPSEAMQRVREMGFAGFISKPIDEDLIVDQLAEVINGGEVWHDGSLPNFG